MHRVKFDIWRRTKQSNYIDCCAVSDTVSPAQIMNLPQVDPPGSTRHEIPLVQMTPKFQNPVCLPVKPADLNHQVHIYMEKKGMDCLHLHETTDLERVLICSVISDVDREHFVRVS